MRHPMIVCLLVSLFGLLHLGCDNSKNERSSLPKSPFGNMGKPSDSKTSGSLVGAWATKTNHPGLGNGISRYTLKSNGAATGELKTRHGILKFIGTWHTRDKASVIQGKFITLVGSTSNTVNHTGELKLQNGNTLSINGVLHQRQ